MSGPGTSKVVTQGVGVGVGDRTGPRGLWEDDRESHSLLVAAELRAEEMGVYLGRERETRTGCLEERVLLTFGSADLRKTCRQGFFSPLKPLRSFSVLDPQSGLGCSRTV